ncbi:hypothetical protein HPG69_007917 [Diceros bicornis minor]|uniref:Centromere protein P n=1 Tax=Diceros bicornis minor TaxID=77932 RepID=A0A7J7EBE9_DICBM|nr:hypothetical protein HPG69_007917 [Diceros bicornis minor]
MCQQPTREQACGPSVPATPQTGILALSSDFSREPDWASLGPVFPTPVLSTVISGVKEKYPEAVHLTEGASSSCMGVRSTSQPGFELVIVWRIQIGEEGKVLPKLDLLTQVPLGALELDKNRVTETAPLSFRTLLGVLGIEATLESLIKLLSTEAND